MEGDGGQMGKADISEKQGVLNVFSEFKPSIVVHLAA